MEMNTRLQVEHPVTEEITGVDLVEWQLRVASGEKLPKRQDELSINGHAIEARLYAEDPAKGFLPSVGRLEYFRLRGARIESGVEENDEISTFYDPMIAKIVTHGDDREDATAELIAACATADVWPVKTNAGFLFKLLIDPAFLHADFDTGFIAANLDRLTEKPPLSEDGLATAAYLLVPPTQNASDGLLRSGLRLNQPPKSTFSMSVDGRMAQVEVPRECYPAARPWTRAHMASSGLIKFDQGHAYEVALYAPQLAGAGIAGDGAILAPMPGKVTAVEVAAGDAVTKGQRLLTLEAMKMEHGLTAPFDGTVAELNTHQGAQVQVDALLARIQKKDEA
jgi:3-methylcrotonyl-CoA carboxylase alpha subunit